MPIIIFKRSRVTELVADILGYDPYWSNVGLLMHMDSATGYTTDVKGHSISSFGTTQFGLRPANMMEA